VNESCHTWMNHDITPEWVMSYANESCRLWISAVSYKDMKESCRTGENQDIHERFVSHMNLSCHTLSHINGSCHTWMSHVTHTWFKVGCFGTTSYLNTSKDKLVMWHIDVAPLPPPGGSFFWVIQSQDSGEIDSNETPGAKSNKILIQGVSLKSVPPAT